MAGWLAGLSRRSVPVGEFGSLVSHIRHTWQLPEQTTCLALIYVSRVNEYGIIMSRSARARPFHPSEPRYRLWVPRLGKPKGGVWLLPPPAGPVGCVARSRRPGISGCCFYVQKTNRRKGWEGNTHDLFALWYSFLVIKLFIQMKLAHNIYFLCKGKGRMLLTRHEDAVILLWFKKIYFVFGIGMWLLIFN